MSSETDEVDLLLFSRPGRIQYEFPVAYESTWGSEYEEQLISGDFDITSDYIEEAVVVGEGRSSPPMAHVVRCFFILSDFCIWTKFRFMDILLENCDLVTHVASDWEGHNDTMNNSRFHPGSDDQPNARP